MCLAFNFLLRQSKLNLRYTKYTFKSLKENPLVVILNLGFQGAAAQINLEIPVLVRSLKSSNVDLSSYLDGRLFQLTLFLTIGKVFNLSHGCRNMLFICMPLIDYILKILIFPPGTGPVEKINCVFYSKTFFKAASTTFNQF